MQPAGDRINRIVVVLAMVVTMRAYAKQAQSRQSITATVVEDTVKPDLRRNTVRITVEWYWATTQHTEAAATWLTVAAVAAFGVAGVRAPRGGYETKRWQHDIDRLMGRD